MVFKTSKTYILDSLCIERQPFYKWFKRIEGGQHHCPVVDETLTDNIIIHLILDFVQRPFPSLLPSSLKVITEMQQLNSYVCRTGITKLNELVKFIRFLFSTLTSLRFQEKYTGEQCSIGGRHLLASQYHSTINIGTFPSLTICTAFRASGIVIDTLKKVNVLMAERVLVFIEVDNHVADLRALITHCIVSSALQITDLRVALKHADDAYGKLRLSRAFLTVDIQQRKRARTVDDDVTEQGSHIKAKRHHPIVTIKFDYKRKIPLQRYIHIWFVHKTTFVDKPRAV